MNIPVLTRQRFPELESLEGRVLLSAVSFASHVDYNTSSNVLCVISADFNGDGAPDLATADYSAGKVSVLMNKGDGTLAAAVNYTVGASPVSLISADFNGDGKPDLAVVNQDSGTVSVLMNKGNGTFAAAVNYTGYSDPCSIASGDFNGDGKPDLAVVDGGSDSVGILLNNGNGTFTAGGNYDVGSSPYSVVAADFNGDGQPDLAVANEGDDTVGVLLNNGDGTGSFAPQVAYDVGSEPDSVTAADFNGDGKPDLAVANYYDNSVSVLLNLGGTFATHVDYATGSNPQCVTAADFNGDGKPDLAVANQDGTAVSLLLNDGNATFGSKTDYAAGMGPLFVTAADFNGDAKPDLAVATWWGSGDAVSTLLNNSVFSYSIAPSTPDLAAASDSGASGTDNVTDLDNSTPAKSLTFLIGGTVSGATVNLYADGVLIGSAAATGATTTVTTNGSLDLTDGPHRITATQTQAGKTQSAASTPLMVTIETSLTAAIGAVSPDPRVTSVDSLVITFSSAFVGGLDIGALSLTRDGSPVDLTDATLNPGDGNTYTLGNLAAATAPAGTYSLTLNLAGLQDQAGNTASGTVVRTWQSNAPSEWGPLFTFTSWDQEGPINGTTDWNKYCPLDPYTLTRSVTGCVATAEAQILNYWRFPSSISFSSADGYTSDGDDGPIEIDADAATYGFLTLAQLNTRMSSITYPLTADEEALLSFAVGIKAQMAYASDASGASFADSTLADFSFEGADESTDWGAIKSTVIMNVESGQPVLIASVDHAMVLDGYNSSDDTFHVDMGWGGDYDNWNSMPTFYADGESFTINDVIYNIEPILPAPAGVQASQGAYSDHVQLTWNATPEATGYEVWRGTTSDPAKASQISSDGLTGTSYDDTAVDNTQTYYYWVKSTSDIGVSDLGAGVQGYLTAPAVEGVSPASGPVAGGTSVTISGTDLLNATAVDFGSTAATIVSDTDTQIVVTSPAGSAGTVHVTVVTPVGTSDTSSADEFTYVRGPMLTASAGSASYLEAAGAVAVDSGITLSDADSTTLVGATVTISGNYADGQDVLGFVNQNGITGSWNAATGVLTLSGSSSVANYQAALRSVTYNDTQSNPNTLARTVSFVANDGSYVSQAATRTVTVTSANKSPVVTATAAALSYTEGDGAVAVDPGVTVTDADSANLVGLTVTISGNYANGQDVLGFTNQNGITGSWVAATGVLTLSGSSSVANYQAALRSVTYDDTSFVPSTLARTITFVANDGASGNNLSAAASRTVTVTAVNQAPVVTATASALSYLEGDGGVAIDPGITVSDVDSANLVGATVTISGNFVKGQDALGFNTQNGITGGWNSSTGVLTLTGSASLANYQAALRSVLYYNTSVIPSTLARTVRFVANDGGSVNNLSAAATRTITVTAVNQPPVVTATAGAISYLQGAGAVAIDPGITVSDVDNTTLAGATVTISGNYAGGADALGFANQNGIAGSWNAATGVLTLSGSATLAYYQAAMRSVTFSSAGANVSTLVRTVSFVADDGSSAHNLSAAATRTITISYMDLSGVLGTTWTLPASAIAGKPLSGSVSVVVSNLGNKALPAGQTVNIDFVAHDTTHPANPDVTLLTLSNQSVSALAGGGTRTFTGTVSQAAGLSADSFQVLANIVPVQSLAESRTDNDQASQTALGAAKTIAVAPQVVDLLAQFGTTFKLPAADTSGDGKAITVPVVVKNVGNVAMASGQKINIQIDAFDGTTTTPIKTLTAQSVSLLAAGGSATFTASVTLPMGLAAGTYNIVAVADSSDLVAADTNRANNTVTSSGTMAVTMGYVDLTGALGTTWTLPSSVIAGKALTGSVSVVVKNSGNVALPTGQTVNVVFVAHDTTNTNNPDITLVTLSGQSVTALAAGGTKTFTGTVSRTAGIAADNYQILANIAPVQALTESNTANNQASQTAAGAAKTLASVAPFVNLAGKFGTTWTLPSSIAAGKSLMGTVSVVVSNLGNVALPAGQTVNIVFVAHDTTNPQNPDITLATLSNQSVSALAAGGTKQFSASIARIAGLPADTYQIEATITPVQALTESNLADNTVLTNALGSTLDIAVV